MSPTEKAIESIRENLSYIKSELEDSVEDAIREAVELEREECARIAEMGRNPTGIVIADQIRSRGNNLGLAFHSLKR
jgi:hypothetical protein